MFTVREKNRKPVVCHHLPYSNAIFRDIAHFQTHPCVLFFQEIQLLDREKMFFFAGDELRWTLTFGDPKTEGPWQQQCSATARDGNGISSQVTQQPQYNVLGELTSMGKSLFGVHLGIFLLDARQV
jgi:hypothetical protein